MDHATKDFKGESSDEPNVDLVQPSRLIIEFHGIYFWNSGQCIGLLTALRMASLKLIARIKSDGDQWNQVLKETIFFCCECFILDGHFDSIRYCWSIFNAQRTNANQKANIQLSRPKRKAKNQKYEQHILRYSIYKQWQLYCIAIVNRLLINMSIVNTKQNIFRIRWWFAEWRYSEMVIHWKRLSFFGITFFCFFFFCNWTVYRVLSGNWTIFCWNTTGTDHSKEIKNP